ncbi:hypothetical protein BC941DRAFT_501728 [Chlamydoabsidia padenii]|nr:hypothetical protein BC941DRAFT_501728 [Chlamydoabsidia padenii]
MTDDDSKQKRNKPCESCRSHRRKCILSHQNLCERCKRMSTPCFFKFSTKPIIPKKPISASKKTRLYQKVWLLEQELLILDAELQNMATTTTQQQQQPLGPLSSWKVCIQKSQHNQLVMETNITNVAELYTLLQQVSFQLQHIPSIPRYSTQPVLPVTIKTTPFEKDFRELFSSMASCTTSTTPPLTPPSFQVNALSICPSSTTTLQQALVQIKQQLIDIYFSCSHLHNPILIKSYYQGYMHQHLNDMITWAVAAYTAYSPCLHVTDLFSKQQQPWTRQQVAELCRLEAKGLLDEAIFDDGDGSSVSWIFTAHLLTHCAFFTLRNRQAYVYADLAWQMALQLKQTHVPVLNSSPMGDNNERLFAETWRRLYFATRFIAITFNLVQDNRINVPELVSHVIGIGFPAPLPCEQQDATLKNAVEAYHDLSRLHHVAHLGPSERVSTLSYRLYTGKLAAVDSDDVMAMEIRFLDYWYTLPADHRISTAPLDYVQMDRVHQCPSLRSLRVNAAYYIMLMSTMLRIMPNPDDSDLAGATVDRMDGEHALMVVSICCDATIKIYQVMHLKVPCTIELHWLTVVLDTVLLLVNAKDPQVRQRAKQGARMAKDIFKRQVGGGQQQPYSSQTPDISPTCTHSTLSTTTTPFTFSSASNSSVYSHTIFYDLLAQHMDAHLSTKDSCF